MFSGLLLSSENICPTRSYEWGNPMRLEVTPVGFFVKFLWVPPSYGLVLRMFSDESNQLETCTYVRKK